MNRAADVALAGVGLALTSPLLAAAALAIKLEDGGPVLFRQTRVGREGEDFGLLKLRSMSVGAEHTGAGYAVIAATRGSRGSGGSSGGHRSTSYRSSGTCSGGTCP